MAIDPHGNWTFSINLGFSLSAFGHGSFVSLNITFSEDSIALQVTHCTPNLDEETSNEQIGVNMGLTVGVQYTELDTIKQTEETEIVAIGGDVMMGADVLIDQSNENAIGWQWGGTLGVALDSHKSVSKTKTLVEIPTLNLPKIFK